MSDAECYLWVGCDYGLGFLQSATKTEVLVMAPHPTIAVIAVAQEAQIIDFHYPF